MLKPVVISNHTISAGHQPFIIAEMSGNHNGSLDRALQIVDAIAASGAQALKLQTYTADTMTLNINKPDFVISDKNSLWYGRKLYELYQEAHTPWAWHKPIFERARNLGLVAFSSAFDATSVDFLMSLDVPCIKIASFENTDIPLLRKVASTGKPVIISTGTANKKEMETALKTLRSAGAKDVIMLKCTSSYPASPTDSNLLTIPDMQKRFKTHIGLSDHTMGIGAAVASVALGACVIEKHVTLSRNDGGVDSAFSLEPHELKALVEETKVAWQAIGKVNYEPTEKEKKSFIFRRSLYVVKDIKKGEKFTAENVRCIRPGYGLAPAFLYKVLGSSAKCDIEAGTALTKDTF